MIATRYPSPKEVYEEGKLARKEGICLEANPYIDHYYLISVWANGWRYADGYIRARANLR